MTTLTSRFVVAAAIAGLASLSACNKEKTPAATGTTAASTATAGDPNQVVAEIGGEKITLAELDQAASSQLFQVRKQYLDNLIQERLVKNAAAKAGLSEEEYIAREIDQKVQPPSEEQIKQVYEQSAGRLPPGSTLEQFKPQIVDFLSRGQKQQRAQELFAQLRKDANVKVRLTEPRKQVEATGPSKGPSDAKVTIVEFSDFECPFCGRVNPTVKQVMDTYAGKVRIVFRHFPLNFHPHAPKAAEAAACADEQGKFWEMHDVLFANQKALEVEKLKEHAKSIGLDTAKFNECLDSGKKADLVKKDMEAGSKAGVNGTPAFFINGVPLSGAVPFEQFKEIIDQELENT